MNVVGRVGSLIATPFHPFGGAVDIIVVEQQDGTYRSTPWYVRFGKFQGVLKGAEKIVRIFVNGIEADFHMFLDNSGEAYFFREVFPGSENTQSSDQESEYIDTPDDIEDQQQNVQCESKEEISYSKQSQGFQDMQLVLESPSDSSEYNNYHIESFDEVKNLVEPSDESTSEMVLMSVDGQFSTAPISMEEDKTGNVQLSTPQFHLGPREGSSEDLDDNGDMWTAGLFCNLNGTSENQNEGVKDVKEAVASGTDNKSIGNIEIDRNAGVTSGGMGKDQNMFKNCIDPTANIEGDDSHDVCSPALVLEKKEEFGHLQEIKLEETTANAELTHSASMSLPSSDLPCSDDMQAVDVEVKDLEGNFSGSSEQNKIVPTNFEEKSLDIENTVGDGSGAISVNSLSNEKEQNEELDISGPQRNSEYGFVISLCGNLVRPGVGRTAAEIAFEAHRISEDEFKASGQDLIKNENLIVRYKEKYYLWNNISHVIVGLALFGSKLSIEPINPIPVESLEIAKDSIETREITPSTSSGKWRLWQIPFRTSRSLQHTNSDFSNDEIFLDSLSSFKGTSEEQDLNISNNPSPKKKFVRTNMPTTEQIASLNLKDGQNKIVFSFSTRVLGTQQVDAHIYLWKWNAKIVISDVDGTITRSDVLGQVMPLVGKDWSQTGVARLFSAIKENGYQLLFLSARAIVQSYLTKSFLFNLKQDGNALPIGPVVISPDGLFPSLYREVIRRAPHEFKIACLQDIRALFPSDYNPFYAGFGNRDTDELSYTKIGIPKGKIFIINPKGEVALHNRTDVKSYTSLHTLVNDMFPPTSSDEQEDFNSWNYWKVPLPIID